jgi:hypothetical protein
MTYSNGTHTVKFGGDINLVKDDINNIRFQGGEFQYTGTQPLNDFIIDYENFSTNGAIRALTGGTNGVCASSTRRAGQCYGGSFNQGIGPLGLVMKTTDYNFFVQDDWKVHPRLTLNLGLRYEYQRNPDPINVNSALPQTANKVSDTNNWGPRIGFAYDMTGDGKTSLRGGWGMYYGRVINSTVYNALINTGLGPDRAQQQLSISSTNLPAGCTARPACPSTRTCSCPSARRRRTSSFARRSVLREQLPVAADSPDRPRLRAPDQPQHGGLDLVPGELRQVPAELRGHEPARARRHRQLQRSRRPVRRSGLQVPVLPRREAQHGLQPDNRDSQRRVLEVPRARASGEPPPDRTAAVPDELHALARVGQRPELGHVHVQQPALQRLRPDRREQRCRTSTAATSSSRASSTTRTSRA